MSDKSSGVDFDREVFAQSQPSGAPPTGRPSGFIFVLVFIAVIAFLAYKLLPQIARDQGSASDPSLANVDKRLAAIEVRLEKLETTRRGAVPANVDHPADPKETSPKPAVKTIYQISPAPERQAHAPQAPDPATTRRLSNLQQGLGALQNDETANREAWQATTDRLADMQGQVGTQGVEILQNRDQLNQLLVRTEMEAIPFELLRGGNPQPVGPVSLLLKSSNPKSQRYTLCVYVQSACVELKDRSLHEVVQFVMSRNTPPLGVIATKIMKDQLLGYLEVPRNQSGR